MRLASYELTIAAPASVVWEHLTTAAGLMRWVGPDAHAEATPGGELRWTHPDGATVVGRAEVLKFKDYLNAVLSHAQKGISAGQTKEAITASKGLPGFEGYQEAPPRLTLAAVLGVAYDELTTK